MVVWRHLDRTSLGWSHMASGKQRLYLNVSKETLDYWRPKETQGGPGMGMSGPLSKSISSIYKLFAGGFPWRSLIFSPHLGEGGWNQSEHPTSETKTSQQEGGLCGPPRLTALFWHAPEVTKPFPFPLWAGSPRSPTSFQNPVHEARLRKEEDVPWGSAFSNVSHILALCGSVLGYTQGKGQNTERKLLQMPSYCILGVHIKSINKKWPNNVKKKWVKS